MEIVVIGFAGFSGSRRIYREKAYRKALLKTYPRRFFAVFEEAGDGGEAGQAGRSAETENPAAQVMCRAGKEGQEPSQTPDSFWQTEGSRLGHSKRTGFSREAAAEIEALFTEAGLPETAYGFSGSGGIFRTLWELLRQHKTGAAFSQARIPIAQQTVEICEFYALNPYRLSSEGCAVCLSDCGHRLCALAEEKGLPAAVIGYTEKGAAIRRTDGDEVAYLRKPELEELLRLWTFQNEGAHRLH